MAFVRVEQRNARLAAAVRLDTVQGREGSLSKALLIAISNVRKGAAEQREEEATSIQWTLWGKLAENAAEYLAKGSRVNVCGRVQNNNYQNAQGEAVYGLTFTCEELDYLDTRQEGEARRASQREGAAPAEAATPEGPAKANGPNRGAGKGGKGRGTAKGRPVDQDDDIPF